MDGRPAYRHLGTPRLTSAVALAERLATDPEALPLLRELDERSLAWRGVTRRRAGRGR